MESVRFRLRNRRARVRVKFKWPAPYYNVQKSSCLINLLRLTGSMATSMLAVTAGPHVQRVFLLAVVCRRDQTADEAVASVVVVLIEQLVVVGQPVQIVVFRRRGNGSQCATVAEVGLAVGCCRAAVGSGLSGCFRQHQRPARRMRVEEKPRVRRLVNIGDGRWRLRRRSRRSRRIVGGCFAASAEDIGDGERSQVFPTEIHFFIGIHLFFYFLFCCFVFDFGTEN